jgi:hypothetical protein
MVQPLEQGLECNAQIGKIHYPASVLAYAATDVNLNAERMAMNPRTLMARRDMRKLVGRFDLENTKYIHRRIVPPGQLLIKPGRQAGSVRQELAAGAKPCPCVRTVTEGFVGGVAATAQRATLFDAFLAVVVVHPQAATEGHRAILDD